MTAIEAPFPSARWFADLVARANADRGAMDRLGIAELRFGAEIVDGEGRAQLFGILLDGYDIESLGAVDGAEFAPEVVVSGPLEDWADMVASIEANGSADGGHTLNTLTLAGVPFEVRADDAMGHDKLFRYMGTLQALFDAAGAPNVAASVR
ncbi:MAG TPA: hypothetical protein VKA05_07425 [Acidimicrobiales bacterium]|nr:hypothetical protein [Acidimicrobiales bacterium]